MRFAPKFVQLALSLAVLLPASPALAGQALDAVRARGTLRVGTTGDYKPFTFRSADGTYSGADVVMAEHLAKELQVKLEFVPTTWSTLLPDFMAHKYDIAMGGVSILPDRAAQGAFSTAVNIDGKRPIVRCADRERFATIAAIDEPGVRVVEPPGASNEAFARANLTRAQLTIHQDNTTIFDEIIARRADVMVTDGIEVDHQAYLHPELCAADVPAPFSKVSKAYLLAKDDPDFLKFVNDWIAQEMSSGDWQHILDVAQHQK
jgi:cyclohexadienyl dehydratase